MHTSAGQEDINLIVATDAGESLALVSGASAALKVQPCHAEPTLVILNEVKNLVSPRGRDPTLR